MNHPPGFSLFEVLVSFTVFSILLFGFAQGISKAYLETLKMHQAIAKMYQDK